MKKLIALILILIISSFIITSEESTPLGIKTAIEKSQKITSKNEKWEYVKNRLFDGETENVYKLKGPILIDLTNATKQDSLAVEETMKELRTILPYKTIDYFKKNTGRTRLEASIQMYATSTKKNPLVELYMNTIELNFNGDLGINDFLYSKTELTDGSEISRNYPSSDLRSNSSIDRNHYFKLNKAIPYDKRKQYIEYEILRSLCYIHPVQVREPYYQNGVFYTPAYVPHLAKFNKLDQFLLQKLYSDDFIAQFKTYMYANYPWRYASLFINKKETKFKAYSIVIGLGLLVFVLMLSYFQNRKFKYSYLNYWFPILFIFLHFINLTDIYHYLTDVHSFIFWSSGNIFVALIISIFVAILISLLLWALEKISIREDMSFSFKLMLKVIFTFISFYAPLLVVILWKSGNKNIIVEISPYLFFTIGLAFGRGVLIYLNHFSESLVKEKDVELSRLREANAEAEVKMLQSQINPHFLYNALNSIASLAHTDADKTEKMALSLSDLFRHSINRKDEKVNRLEDEVKLVQNYLEIEQIRFGDRLEFTIDVAPDLLAIEIPMFILQPLVENAIKHGISKIEGKGEIALKVNRKDKGILISVLDNGPDFPEGLVSGHGLQTVYDLLRFSYGDKAAISWHNQPQKEITIYIADI